MQFIEREAEESKKTRGAVGRKTASPRTAPYSVEQAKAFLKSQKLSDLSLPSLYNLPPPPPPPSTPSMLKRSNAFLQDEIKEEKKIFVGNLPASLPYNSNGEELTLEDYAAQAPTLWDEDDVIEKIECFCAKQAKFFEPKGEREYGFFSCNFRRFNKEDNSYTGGCNFWMKQTELDLQQCCDCKFPVRVSSTKKDKRVYKTCVWKYSKNPKQGCNLFEWMD